MSAGSYGLLLSVLRGEANGRVSAEEAAQAARLARGDGLLPFVLGALLPSLSAEDAALFENEVGEDRWVAKSNLDNLALIKREADSLGMRFVAVKGTSLSAFVFGDPLARVSNDVDILVAHADLAKADCAVRRCGFVQPSESYRARQLMRSGMLDERMLRGIEAPFLSRTSEMAPHVIPYHRINNDGSVCTLEIHDSFHLLGRDEAERLLWRCVPVTPNGIGVMAPCPSDVLLLLLLSAHDDIEAIRANLGTTTLALRTLYEVSLVLASSQAFGIDLGQLAGRIAELGLEGQLAPVFSDLCEAFPAAEDTVRAHFKVGCSPWGMGYVERLENRERMAENAFGVICGAVASCGRMPTRTRNSFELAELGIEAEVRSPGGRGGGAAVVWRVPKRLGSWQDGLVLHVTLLDPDTEAGCLGLRVRTFAADSGWRSFSQQVTAAAFDEHPNRALKGEELPTTACTDGDVMEIRVSLDCEGTSGRALFSVYAKQQCTHYRLVAGCSLGAFVGRTLAEGRTAGRNTGYGQHGGPAVGSGVERGNR